METKAWSGDLSGAEFADARLTGARFLRCDLTDVVVRGSELQRVELDSPWLFEGKNSLLVNGVDVLAYVDAELDRRFPGRALRHAGDPAGLREAWAAVEDTWSRTLDRVAAMPPGAVDISVAGEWSFAQTLRHLVLATDIWLRRGILGVDQPFHPLGLIYAEGEEDGMDMSVFRTDTPTYAEVLEARTGRVAMVRDLLADITPEMLAEPRDNPHGSAYPETVLSCVHTILEEEWEHHRYAVRDLDSLEP